MDVESITNSLTAENIIGPPPITLGFISDFAVVVTEFGVYSAILELHSDTRLPTRVVVWAAAGSVPIPAMDLLAAAEYSQGLSVWDARSNDVTPISADDPTDQVVLATVLASRSDFQYQLPAGPKYFIGRRGLIATLKSFLDSESRSVIFNAQSGWGKSSLALKFAQLVEERGGIALVMDTRTAGSIRYVTEVLRRTVESAVTKNLASYGAEVSWASLPSALATINDLNWRDANVPVLVFFDQFENVFRSPELTQAFRDLAFGIREVDGPIIIGFAWKTDLVGWIEGYPYQLRDDIRSASKTVLVEPFGSSEVTTLLDRLQRNAEVNLGRDLRNRLREYSQGLPWLLKKLADHVLQELRTGTSPEQLLADALNVQSLFDADLAELEPESLEILNHIARFAPIPAGEVTERYAPEAVQSLVDRRLIVQVGDRLDTYWDIFRDYLITGRVPLEDSYILRSAPNQIARMLPLVMKRNGRAKVSDLSESLKTSDNVIFNLSRELRLFGVTVYEPLTVKIADDILASPDPELATRAKVLAALRRHRAYTAALKLAAKNDGVATVEGLSAVLPGIFPAVSGRPGTWAIYSRVFYAWFEYAGLAVRQGKRWLIQTDSGGVQTQRLLSRRSGTRARPGVPQESPRIALELLSQMGNGGRIKAPVGSTPQRGGLRTLASLGAVDVDPDGYLIALRADLFDSSGDIQKPVLLGLLRAVPGGQAGLDYLEENPAASSRAVGALLRSAIDASWTDISSDSIGGYFRAWAKALGVKVDKAPRQPRRSE